SGVHAGDPGLDIDERRSVQAVDGIDAQTTGSCIHINNGDGSKTDRIRPDRRAQRKHAGRSLPMAWCLYDKVPPCGVQPVEQHDTHAGYETRETGPPWRVEHHRASATSFARLAEV